MNKEKIKSIMNWSTEIDFFVKVMIMTEIDEIKLLLCSWKSN